MNLSGDLLNRLALILLTSFIFSSLLILDINSALAQDALLDVQDSWRVSQIDYFAAGCGIADINYDYGAKINQERETIDYFGKRPSGGLMNLFGNLAGNKLNLKGSFPESSGVSTITSSNLVFSEDCSSFEGDLFWNWKSPSRTCSSSSHLTGTRLSSKDCGIVKCEVSWVCEAWSTCLDGKQTRKCADSNACGTVLEKPEESQSCTVALAEEGKKSLQINYALIGSIAAVILILAAVIWIVFYIFKKRRSTLKAKPAAKAKKIKPIKKGPGFFEKIKIKLAEMKRERDRRKAQKAAEKARKQREAEREARKAEMAAKREKYKTVAARPVAMKKKEKKKAGRKFAIRPVFAKALRNVFGIIKKLWLFLASSIKKAGPAFRTISLKFSSMIPKQGKTKPKPAKYKFSKPSVTRQKIKIDKTVYYLIGAIVLGIVLVLIGVYLIWAA